MSKPGDQSPSERRLALERHIEGLRRESARAKTDSAFQDLDKPRWTPPQSVSSSLPPPVLATADAAQAPGLTQRHLEILDALAAAAEAYRKRNAMLGYHAMRIARRIVFAGLTQPGLDLREPRDWEQTQA